MHEQQRPYALQQDGSGQEASSSTPARMSPYQSPGAQTDKLPDAPSAPDTQSVPAVIRIEHVTKRFRNVAALRDVSLEVPSGEVFGLLGPNGAGKTTLLKLLLGFLHPDKGTIRLFGSTNLARARAQLGYLPERAHYHGNFTGREYVYFHAGLSGLSSKEARSVADQVLEVVGLKDAARRRIRTYSKGMRQRLGLAVVLSSAGGNPPSLLLLDEPASGLDPEGQVFVRDFILGCKERGSTVLLSSHQLTEVERTCTSVGILRAGRLVLQTRLDETPRINIVALPRDGAITLTPHLILYIKNLHPATVVERIEGADQPLYVSLPTGPTVPRAVEMKAAALRAMLDARWDIVSVHVESKDLETLYMRVVRPRKEKEDAKDEKPAPPTSPASTGSPTTPLPPVEEALPASAIGPVAGGTIDGRRAGDGAITQEER